jgi:hypothetical protein
MSKSHEYGKSHEHASKTHESAAAIPAAEPVSEEGPPTIRDSVAFIAIAELLRRQPDLRNCDLAGLSKEAYDIADTMLAARPALRGS